ncbi:zinc ribbon domain-containing protein [Pseudonocardia zijingensis]|jgi:putative FmdB family regulatory protein|uniref:Putative regulatory protein FmdB zinc ribbon domain-containing protein n=1 Tax=Pseudonocardia zijingensis TaxID=153376 RepID=A0ABP3YJL8_9PSEU
MVTYQYRCAACGDVDVRRPMGAATSHVPCPRCGADARRVYTSPRTRLVAPGLVSALDTAGASAENPQVVRREVAPRAPRHAHPLHARLPRP